MNLSDGNRYVLTECSIATMVYERKDSGLIEDGALVVEGNKIAWVGEKKHLPDHYLNYTQSKLNNRLITPGLIDCHTHIVFGGNRSKEFDMRLNGKSYQEIAASGGGIASTVKATRASSEEELINTSLIRLDDMISKGVTTIEIKSGYGLDINTECMMLRVAKKLESLRPIRIKKSFLGSHAIPPEYKDDSTKYIYEVCIPALKKAFNEGLVDAVDGFCETVALSVEQMELVFKVAQELDLPVKLHAEQLSHLGGTKLASRYNALSVDHLEYANEDDVKSMANSGSVAVVLPGAFYTLKEKQKPPIESFRKHKVPIAVATDCNPGSSPMTSLLLAMNMACTFFNLTPQETMEGVTRIAAKALGEKKIGIISEGMIADLSIWDVNHPSEMSYRIGFNSLYKRIFGGQM